MSKRGAEGAAAEKAAAETSAPAPRAAPPGLPGPGGASDAPLGAWASDTGKCRIFKDSITGRLTYEEPLPNDRRLHGWLDRVEQELSLWRGSLSLLEAGQAPWYGPSFGPQPETVGSIQVRSLPATAFDSTGTERAGDGEATMETQIRVAEEDTTWQPPVRFRRDLTAESTTVSAPKIQWTMGGKVSEEPAANGGGGQKATDLSRA
eukprot:CAMPEP_0171065288 /NCGR_PEP_ID=MMETSP0766_2-20121228/6754_1 /TAXON_ID=439317 /ORGANISM="Gambierdiscus australes, Strain CAWD 149" /LENGTH=205 /DNA_ID=CAMNT_0011521367 /DNA_START=18 /DNA_END=636 /DNA_ORIENTATION=-